jgi:3-hydroxyisobutyrate dehydrogenase
LAAASAREAAEGAGVLVVMVRDAAQARAVLLDADCGAVHSLARGSVVWLACTVAPADAKSLAADLAAHGLPMVDGPVSGGATGAEAGTLSIMAGGDTAAVERLRPVMAACGGKIFHVGEAGAGSGIKLINQILTASHIALSAEAVSLCRRLAIDPDLMIEVVTQSAGNSVQFQKRAPRMAHGDHARQSTVNIFLKDLRIALNGAADAGARAPMAEAAYATFGRAAALGLGEESDTRVLSAYDNDTDDTHPRGT